MSSLQEIQGLQSRNGALEGAMGTLMEERDNLVRALKGHLPRCQDSMAMARSAQLLAFSPVSYTHLTLPTS